jgi:hypothetical protein
VKRASLFALNAASTLLLSVVSKIRSSLMLLKNVTCYLCLCLYWAASSALKL